MFFGGLTIAIDVFSMVFFLLPSLSMVFDGSGPLAKRCDGFDGSLWSNAVRSPDRAVGTKARRQCQRWCRPTSSPPCSSSPPCCSQHQTPPPNGCFAHQQPILESQSHKATCLKDTDQQIIMMFAPPCQRRVWITQKVLSLCYLGAETEIRIQTERDQLGSQRRCCSPT